LNTIPLEVWNATNGTWDPSGTTNVATLSAAPSLLAGDNIVITQSGGNITISANDNGSTGGSGSGSGAGSSGTGSSYNPMDPTQFFKDHLALETGFNAADGWTYTGDCGNGAGSGATGFSQETVVPGAWAQVSGAGNECLFVFPDAASPVYGTGTYDYWSGNTPAQLWVSATYLTADTNGTQYVGLVANTATLSDFIGCRQIGSGDWMAVIRSGGADVATADTGVAHDTLTHRVTVDNSTGTANTIRCTIDGASTATASGAIPAEPFGWTYLVGATASGASAANWAYYQYTIFLQGLPRQ
jgi:hypothetical protein